MAKFLAIACMALALANCALAYPQFWGEEYRPNCFSVPTAGTHCHKAPKPDPATLISLYPATNGKVAPGAKPVTTACAGKQYVVQISFPEPRLSYVTMSSGRVASLSAANFNTKCPNTMTFSKSNGFSPSKQTTTVAVAPAAGTWQVSVASASGGCAPFMIGRASIRVGSC